MEGKTRSCNECLAEPCIINERSKEREKRLLSCGSPGCRKLFHVACVGKAKVSDKELAGLFFVCLRCEAYLKYSADIARKSIMTELDIRLAALEKSIYQYIDQRFKKETDKLKLQLELKIDRSSKCLDEKLSELDGEVRDTIDSLSKRLEKSENDFSRLEFELKDLNAKHAHELNELKCTCNAVTNQVSSMDVQSRKKTFIIRNFPERNNHSETSEDILATIARALNLECELMNVKQIHRLGKPRQDGRPRLLLVRTTERTAKMFLSRSSLLRHANRPLDKVYLQENLSVEASRKLAEMRKRAFYHRANNPGDEAFVRNKKLIINGSVVDELKQNF